MTRKYLSAHAVHAMIDAAVPDVPRRSVTEWVVENVRFAESSYRGPFEIAGREYVADILEDFNRADVTDEVLVFGSQAGKTALLMAAIAWCLKHDPCGFMLAFANIAQARKTSRQRFIPMLKATAETRALVPTGAARHDLSTLDMVLGSSTLNWTGSNSAANLASLPCRRVILDEVDKFDEGGSKESDAVNLAEQRTKDQPSPQRWKTSTPTTPEGLIWREYLKGDQRRYFLPCPGCGKDLVLAWSPQFTVLPKLGCEAYVKWDQRARMKDHFWELDLVAKSAFVECPFCKAAIRDDEKAGMVQKAMRTGWRPTATAAASGFVSRHLSSLYATSPETSWGRMAVKFLQAKDTIQGLQGFINGDLAEPYMSQDLGRERHQYVTARVEVGDEWRPLLTIDCQAKSPSFWYVVRVWNDGNSRAVAASHADTWEELDAIQAAHKVDACGVFVDSGYGARSDAEVYKECARRCETLPSGGKSVLVGWMPMKGQPGRKRWKHPQSGASVSWFSKSVDPWEGTNMQGLGSLDLLEFSTDAYKDVLDALQRKQGGFSWEVPEDVATEEYLRHMDGEIKTAVRHKFSGLTKWSWVPRHKTWPNHLRDCEVMQLVAANYLGLFQYEVTK